MPITSSDIQYRLSGGASNALGSDSLGGVKSSNAAPTTIDTMFDRVSSAEALAGDIEYRCVYIHNAYTSAMLNSVVWLSANTASATTTIAIGLGTSALNGVEQTVANENTAPVGVTFSEPASQGAGIALGDIPSGQHRAVWVRRTINAGTAAVASDSATLSTFAEAT